MSRIYGPGDFDPALEHDLSYGRDFDPFYMYPTLDDGSSLLDSWTDPKPPPEVPERAELLWYMIDLDGCLAEAVYDSSDPSTAMRIGPPIFANLKKLHEVVYAGYKVIIHTSKPWAAYEAIEAWLEHYGVPYKAIQCGKPLGHRYVDDRAINSAEVSWLA